MISPYRNKILELFDEGLVGKDDIFINLLNFISESDAKEFYEQYWEEDEEDEEEDDGQPDESQEWHSFDEGC